VFIDASVVVAEEPARSRSDAPRLAAAPGVGEAVQLLVEGYDVVVLGGQDLEAIPELAGCRAAASMPDAFPTGSWYITGDSDWCEGDRPAGLRSILVGPRRPPARRPTLRCDLEARDLSAAVMEILVRETMA
jgi:hypothetical protein